MQLCEHPYCCRYPACPCVNPAAPMPRDTSPERNVLPYIATLAALAYCAAIALTPLPEHLAAFAILALTGQP